LGAVKYHIRVFEYETIKLKQVIDEVEITAHFLASFQKFYGEKGCVYFSLVHNGIRFGSYVGVIQIGKYAINVLPKADKIQLTEKDESEKDTWNRMLIDMLRTVGVFNIHAPSSSSLNLKSNSILDLYFQLFVQEVEYLLHRGLVKKYRKAEGNTTALKGSLLFNRHIQHNLIHKERFYVRHTVYDKEHVLHQILRKALLLLSRINTNAQLQSKIDSLTLDFPETKDLKVSEALFEQINFDRKTEPYRNAIEIARLLLLNYHPDVSKGRDDVLALMFDMNMLWEQFVYVSLRKYLPNEKKVSGQTSKKFWKRIGGRGVGMRPDIVINKGAPNAIVLDTKWKNLNGKNPSPDDLRQMYVYHQYYKAVRVALLYPGKDSMVSGKYFDFEGKEGAMECSLMAIPVELNIRNWQERIAKSLHKWAGFEEKLA
jgi:5-methylcytosine-specific restriction enzyme subunit McrC